jgi:putative SOS response-associated peptidase YedK
MCGRFTLRAAASAIAEQFAVFEAPGFAPRYNIAPSQLVPVVRASAPRREGESAASGHKTDRELAWLRWGLVPSWADDPAIGARLINARAESAAEKPAFRAAMRQRRCLIVADGFYEWRRSGRTKQPYFIRRRDDCPFAFAGVWEAWQRPGQAGFQSCTILTTEANDLIRPIHDRMPVIVAATDYAAWLDPATEDPRQLSRLLTPCPGDAMRADPVGNCVNSPAHDSPQCIEAALPKGNILFPDLE